VRVIRFVTRQTIEERVQATMLRKANLFAGLFDGEEDEIAFERVSPMAVAAVVTELLDESVQEKAPMTEEEFLAPPHIMDSVIDIIANMFHIISQHQHELTQQQRERLSVLHGEFTLPSPDGEAPDVRHEHEMNEDF
jgi:citrate synthase